MQTKIKQTKMRKMFRKIIPFLFLLAFLPGCSNDDDAVRTMADIAVVIKSGETYKFVVTTGKTEDALLIKQPASYEVSEFKKDTTTTNGIYTYKPKAGFIGVDEVELERRYFSFENERLQRNKARIKIRITVEKDIPEKLKDQGTGILD